jgi:hypothetical protein
MSTYKMNIGAWKRSMGDKGGWIGVDLDATLAEYNGWHGPYHVGAPIKAMADRVKAWLAAGIKVKIFTARASEPRDQAVIYAIEQWCERHLGQVLEVTNQKDYLMIQLWDDRAVQVTPNTGMRADGEPEECCYDGNCPDCNPIECGHASLLPEMPVQCGNCGKILQ